MHSHTHTHTQSDLCSCHSSCVCVCECVRVRLKWHLPTPSPAHFSIEFPSRKCSNNKNNNNSNSSTATLDNCLWHCTVVSLSHSHLPSADARAQLLSMVRTRVCILSVCVCRCWFLPCALPYALSLPVSLSVTPVILAIIQLSLIRCANLSNFWLRTGGGSCHLKHKLIVPLSLPPWPPSVSSRIARLLALS